MSPRGAIRTPFLLLRNGKDWFRAAVHSGRLCFWMGWGGGGGGEKGEWTNWRQFSCICPVIAHDFRHNIDPHFHLALFLH